MAASQARPQGPAAADANADAAVASPPQKLRRPRGRMSALLRAGLGGAVLAMAGALVVLAWRPAAPAGPTVAQLEQTVRQVMRKSALPSNATRAWKRIAPSVVQVRGDEKPGPDAPSDDPASPHRQRGGTGVVIHEGGLILTSLHVVDGAQDVEVVFADGSVSPARVVNTRESDDLAVLQARKLPDDLKAATLRGTADLSLGDEVIAVGYPFGLGPSVSAGVVSGLKREFRAPDGERVLSNLIQFDAAANPGNSGGPLVTAEGEVIGIVAAILNPGRQHTFIGIGFAVPIENAATAAGMPPH